MHVGVCQMSISWLNARVLLDDVNCWTWVLFEIIVSWLNMMNFTGLRFCAFLDTVSGFSKTGTVWLIQKLCGWLFLKIDLKPVVLALVSFNLELCISSYESPKLGQISGINLWVGSVFVGFVFSNELRFEWFLFHWKVDLILYEIGTGFITFH